MYRASGRGMMARHGRWMIAAAIGGMFALGAGADPLPLTPDDLFQPGTQPDPDGAILDPIVPATQCSFCHAGYAPDVEPVTPWRASMMGQAARDPVFHAGLSIAEQDAPGIAEYCIRCHAPNAWLRGHFEPDSFDALDQEGVACNFCHRLVDPVLGPQSPEQDDVIIEDLDIQGLMPPQGSNARYVFDPTDARRGPFDDLPANPHFGVEVIYSPFHSNSELCWTCHDVSNPLMSKQPDGTYAPNAFGAPHPTHQQNDMMPLHRTYTEWLHSYYGRSEGIDHQGRFGGNHPTGIMKTCQDCHMPDQQGAGCGLGGVFGERPNVPQHSFIGSNTWVLGAVWGQYGESSGMTEASMLAAIARNVDMLEKATDMFVTQSAQTIKVRLMNFTGHKFPTGYPDGRRAWINVKFYDDDETLLVEHGAYDFETAELNGDDTKVYECELGVSEEQAKVLGVPAGHTYHFVLANETLKDNRIPPNGYLQIPFAQNGAAPVGATYLNGQHWDDTVFDIPSGARTAVVTAYYQTTSKEFIEFLRDANVSGDGNGQAAYDWWVAQGKSSPIAIDMLTKVLTPHGGVGDLNQDGWVDAADLALLLSVWGLPLGPPADLDGDTMVGPGDLAIILSNWYPAPRP
ncbi:MAG: hypothetical protein KDA25_12925 [Phycisphaerales bacterium]|nr:hypothetical protein [Phycisphaerales bacterium]